MTRTRLARHGLPRLPFAGAALMLALTPGFAQNINALLRDGAPSAPPAAEAPAPAPTKAPPPAAARLSKELLREHGTQASTLVVVIKKQGYATGSGFFIAPNLMMTNRHVLEDIKGDPLVFAGDRKRYSAKIEARTAGATPGDHDFAVMQVPMPDTVKPVVFTTRYNALDEVYAFGFPGIVMQKDPQFEALATGDTRAMPTIVISSGAVQSVMESKFRVEIITHSAQFSKGNSGGPLFDACGRVVGINTYGDFSSVVTASAKGRTVDVVNKGYHYSLSAAEIVKFLKSRGYEVNVDNTPCSNG